MTTIAATKDAIGGDRMVFVENKGIWYPTVKVRRVKGMLVGAAGHGGDCTRLLDWAEAGFPEKKKPKFEESHGTEDEAILLLVKKDGIYSMTTGDPEPEKIELDFYAIGSGGKAARAALMAGKTLEEAMEIAADIDPYTRGPFDILSFKDNS